MSITDVTSRISQIQSQLALLAPRATTPAASASSSLTIGQTDFTSALAQASGDLSGLSGAGATGGSAEGQAVVAEAKKYLGLPYVWGGTDPAKGLDCSGLVQLVYKNLGYDLPRVSYQQAASGRPVASMAEAQPGDLIAWDNSSRNNGVDHIAIYIGGGKMIEAPRTGLDVRIIDVPSTPDVIRRIIPDAPAGAPAALTASSAVGSPAGLPVGSPMGGLAGVAGVAGVAGIGSGVGVDQIGGRTPYADLFRASGARHGVSPALLAAVAKQESGFDASAVSPAGAEGLMQIMPATARELGVDAFDPAQAVDGAARYLRDMLDRFGSTELALAGYNAGPGAVMRYDDVPPYAETQKYVTSVMSMLGGSR